MHSLTPQTSDSVTISLSPYDYIVHKAAQEARQLKHTEINAAHIALALFTYVREKRDSDVAKFLRNDLGADYRKLKMEIRRELQPGTPVLWTCLPKATDEAVAVFDRATSNAAHYGDPKIEPRHVLLALVMTRGEVSDKLQQLGVTEDAVRGLVKQNAKGIPLSEQVSLAAETFRSVGIDPSILLA